MAIPMKRRAMAGAAWIAIELAGGQTLAFVTFLILARILAPEDFGVATLAMVLVAVPQVLINQGFSEAIIQREDLSDAHKATAFATNLGLSVLFFIIAQVFAPWLARGFGYPLLEPVLRVVAVNFVFTALTSIPGALLRRNFSFRTFTIRTVIAALIGGSVGIAMALDGFGVWALVGNTVANGFMSVVVIWAGNPWRPRLQFSTSAFRDLFRFSSQTMIVGFVQFTLNKCDAIIVGAFIDAKSLGYYYLAQRLLAAAEMVTIEPVTFVSLPTLSRIVQERARFLEGYAMMVWAAASLWLPIVAGMGAMAFAVPIIFGPKWVDAVAVLQVMSLLSITQPLMSQSETVLLSTGQPHITVRLAMMRAVVMLSLVVPATHYGIVGVAAAVCLTSLIMVAVHLPVLARRVHVDVGALLSRYALIVIAGVSMVLTVRIIHWARPEGLSAIVAEIVAGAAVYAAVLCLLARRETLTLFTTLRDIGMRIGSGYDHAIGHHHQS